MQPCCLGLIILLSIPLMAWIIHLYRKGFFSSYMGLFIIRVAVLLVLTIAYYPILKHWFGFTNLEEAAQFGDQYGALNCFSKIAEWGTGIQPVCYAYDSGNRLQDILLL